MTVSPESSIQPYVDVIDKMLLAGERVIPYALVPVHFRADVFMEYTKAGWKLDSFQSNDRCETFWRFAEK